MDITTDEKLILIKLAIKRIELPQTIPPGGSIKLDVVFEIKNNSKKEKKLTPKNVFDFLTRGLYDFRTI